MEHCAHIPERKFFAQPTTHTLGGKETRLAACLLHPRESGVSVIIVSHQICLRIIGIRRSFVLSSRTRLEHSKNMGSINSKRRLSLDQVAQISTESRRKQNNCLSHAVQSSQNTHVRSQVLNNPVVSATDPEPPDRHPHFTCIVVYASFKWCPGVPGGARSLERCWSPKTATTTCTHHCTSGPNSPTPTKPDRATLREHGCQRKPYDGTIRIRVEPCHHRRWCRAGIPSSHSPGKAVTRATQHR